MDNRTGATEPVELSRAALASLPAEISVPTYAPTMRQSIVHIGVGGFHRAHLATYVDELCEAGHTDWGIVGSGVMPGDEAIRQALDTQEGLYSLIVRGPEETSVSVVGSILHYIPAWSDQTALIDKIAHPDTQIISLTITESGYPIDDVDGTFLADSPNASPTGAFAIIAAGLEMRRMAGGRPITIMSCDNIMSNGEAARTATFGMAAQISAELLEWVKTSVSFPNSMVDRITPATKPPDAQWLLETHNVRDEWPVVTEPFRQWVLEDNFAGDRPPLEELDIIVTDDVEPYEFMKLRLLNAGHSCLAYLAALHNIETVDAAMAEPSIREYVSTFLHVESKPVLPAVAGVDVDDYIESLLDRFANPAIGDQISRLCLDGSAKFPKFLVPTVVAQVAADGPVALSALALAAWCDYLNGTTHDGSSIDIAADPNFDEIVALAQASKDDPTAFLAFDDVFASGLATSPRFRDAFTRSLKLLRSSGIVPAIEDAMTEARASGVLS